MYVNKINNYIDKHMEGYDLPETIFNHIHMGQLVYNKCDYIYDKLKKNSFEYYDEINQIKLLNKLVNYFLSRYKDTTQPSLQNILNMEKNIPKYISMNDNYKKILEIIKNLEKTLPKIEEDVATANVAEAVKEAGEIFAEVEAIKKTKFPSDSDGNIQSKLTKGIKTAEEIWEAILRMGKRIEPSETRVYTFDVWEAEYDSGGEETSVSGSSESDAPGDLRFDEEEITLVPVIDTSKEFKELLKQQKEQQMKIATSTAAIMAVSSLSSLSNLANL